MPHPVLSLSKKIRRQRNQIPRHSWKKKRVCVLTGQMIAASTNPWGRTTSSSSQWPLRATSDPGQTRRPEQPRPFCADYAPREAAACRRFRLTLTPYSHSQEISSQKDPKSKIDTSATTYHFPFVLYKSDLILCHCHFWLPMNFAVLFYFRIEIYKGNQYLLIKL